jgi:hypothetical protein
MAAGVEVKIEESCISTPPIYFNDVQFVQKYSREGGMLYRIS